MRNTKKEKLRRAIQNKRHGVVLHDNARPHTAVCTRALLGHFDWELFDLPPCGPDLDTSDYHIFTYLNNWVGPQGFNNNEQLIESVKTWLSSQAADFIDTGIQKLIPQYKCLNSSSNYVEK
jgi:hypothetical protein